MAPVLQRIQKNTPTPEVNQCELVVVVGTLLAGVIVDVVGVAEVVVLRGIEMP